MPQEQVQEKRMIITLDDLLKKYIPEEMAEFANAPWDYKIFCPLGFEDEAKISIYLSIGKYKKIADLTFDLLIKDVEVIKTHIDSPKIKS